MSGTSPRTGANPIKSSAQGREWSQSEMASLVGSKSEQVVTLMMPTHLPGPSSHEDHIRLKNLMSRIEAVGKGAEALVQSLHALIAEPGFWSHPKEGLAVFADATGIRQYRVSATLPELAMVGRRPHITPLLPLLEGEGRFYILELHQHGVRLHEGSKFSMRELVISGFSGKAEEHQHSHADRSEARVVVDPSTHIKHVHLGSAHEEGAKERALKYFRSVDEAIRPIIQLSGAPLLISGVEWLQPLYAEVNHYPQLIHSGIHGDTAALGTHELHDRAWKIVGPRFMQVQAEDLERHAQLRRSGQAISDLPEVIVAILAGRVSSLVVAKDHVRWGSVDEVARTVAAHAARLPDDEDLLNTAVVLGLRYGARVWAVDTALIPGGSGISACLRY